ncbi:hypothetical protein [Streptomyces sp. WAC06614]|uniref:hypothetical protein n=1 Tax=Streptomyces sp. WAC06614 TaxID=2487416 RepID=UPI000F79D66C|nr:hypothetical protein [Streptomyces sp. WAC06614]RSS82618.1 hypothetical protein EF918_06280 [Streptomyces sp. WAC06614]
MVPLDPGEPAATGMAYLLTSLGDVPPVWRRAPVPRPARGDRGGDRPPARARRAGAPLPYAGLIAF